MMRAKADIPPAHWFAYFARLGFGLIALATLATTAGHFAADALPPFAVTCLLFLSPSYFLRMVTRDDKAGVGFAEGFFGD